MTAKEKAKNLLKNNSCLNCKFRHTKFGWAWDPPEVRSKIFYCGKNKVSNTDHEGIVDLPKEGFCDDWIENQHVTQVILSLRVRGDSDEIDKLTGDLPLI